MAANPYRPFAEIRIFSLYPIKQLLKLFQINKKTPAEQKRFFLGRLKIALQP